MAFSFAPPLFFAFSRIVDRASFRRESLLHLPDLILWVAHSLVLSKIELSTPKHRIRRAVR